MKHPPLSVQIDRLRKHWLACRTGYDEIALLDLAHSLRVVGEASDEVARLVADRKSPGLPHASLTRQIKKLIGPSDFLAILLPGGVKTAMVEAITVVLIKRPLTEQELQRMRDLLHRHIAGEKLAPHHWFGAEIVVARRTTPIGQERIGLSRTVVIKRVANTLGGSHLGTDGSDNRFDWAVDEMLACRIGGIPAPYCVLMKIAQDILFALDPTLLLMRV